jgi:hypothetical protein
MRITLSGAMRARDVSRPTDEQVAAAAEREAKAARVGRPGGADRARGPASATSGGAALGGAGSAGAISADPAPGRPAKAAADKPNGPTVEAPGWDNGRAGRGDAVTPVPAADDTPSPRRRRRRAR